MFYKVTSKPDFKSDLTNLELIGIKATLRHLFKSKGDKNYKYSSYNSSGNDGAALCFHTIGTSNQITIEYISDYDSYKKKDIKEYVQLEFIKISTDGALYIVSYSDDNENIYIKVDLNGLTH